MVFAQSGGGGGAPMRDSSGKVITKRACFTHNNGVDGKVSRGKIANEPNFEGFARYHRVKFAANNGVDNNMVQPDIFASQNGSSKRSCVTDNKPHLRDVLKGRDNNNGENMNPLPNIPTPARQQPNYLKPTFSASCRSPKMMPASHDAVVPLGVRQPAIVVKAVPGLKEPVVKADTATTTSTMTRKLSDGSVRTDITVSETTPAVGATVPPSTESSGTNLVAKTPVRAETPLSWPVGRPPLAVSQQLPMRSDMPVGRSSSYSSVVSSVSNVSMFGNPTLVPGERGQLKKRSSQPWEITADVQRMRPARNSTAPATIEASSTVVGSVLLPSPGSALGNAVPAAGDISRRQAFLATRRQAGLIGRG